MEYITTTLGNLVHQTAFMNLTCGQSGHDRGGLCLPVSGNQDMDLSLCFLCQLHLVCCL